MIHEQLLTWTNAHKLTPCQGVMGVWGRLYHNNKKGWEGKLRGNITTMFCFLLWGFPYEDTQKRVDIVTTMETQCPPIHHTSKI